MKRVLLLIVLSFAFLFMGCDKDKEKLDATITLKGESNITLFVGDSYIEQGYSAESREDKKELTSKVIVSGWNGDSSKSGVYKIEYKIEGCDFIAERTVKVVDFVESPKEQEDITVEKGSLDEERTRAYLGMGYSQFKDEELYTNTWVASGNSSRERVKGGVINSDIKLPEVDQICEYDYNKFMEEVKKKTEFIEEDKLIKVDWRGFETEKELLKNKKDILIFKGIKRVAKVKYSFENELMIDKAYESYINAGAFSVYSKYGNIYESEIITGGDIFYAIEYDVRLLSEKEREIFRRELIESWQRFWKTEDSTALNIIYGKFYTYPKVHFGGYLSSNVFGGLGKFKAQEKELQKVVEDENNESKLISLKRVFKQVKNLSSSKGGYEKDWNNFFENREEILNRTRAYVEIRADISLMKWKYSNPEEATTAEKLKFVEDCQKAIDEIDTILDNEEKKCYDYLTAIPNPEPNPYEELYKRFEELNLK